MDLRPKERGLSDTIRPFDATTLHVAEICVKVQPCAHLRSLGWWGILGFGQRVLPALHCLIFGFADIVVIKITLIDPQVLGQDALG